MKLLSQQLQLDDHNFKYLLNFRNISVCKSLTLSVSPFLLLSYLADIVQPIDPSAWVQHTEAIRGESRQYFSYILGLFVVTVICVQSRVSKPHRMLSYRSVCSILTLSRPFNT